MQTPYDVLGVPRKASIETIRAAFRRTVKACHPDLNAGDRTAEQRLRLAIAAYKILKSPQERSAYNRYLRDHHRKDGNHGGGEFGCAHGLCWHETSSAGTSLK